MFNLERGTVGFVGLSILLVYVLQVPEGGGTARPGVLAHPQHPQQDAQQQRVPERGHLPPGDRHR